MNANTKTGIFWGVAVVMLLAALIVSWPSSQREGDGPIAGRPLFEEFKDPLAATSLKVVTFDELLGQLNNFEVRKDRETGLWTIPSRQGYPADAAAQMNDAANSLVGLTILDVQTENAEDHDDLGVVEPKLEDLEVGDDGVGRLVTFKDEAQKTIAALIIGYPVEGEEGRIYVRKPGQDPVYVVKLDDAPLTTRFENWIEEDLLQLSSIEVRELELKDYSASLNPLEGFALTRNFTAEVSTDGTDWTIDKLLEYNADNPLADPNNVEIDPARKPNATKLNEIKNSLDELKIVDVARKPEGMSDNLRADKELVSDQEALASLARRGFYPVQMGEGGATEVLSANGELTATLEDGVEYVLRFGNVSGLSEDDEDDQDSADGDDSPAKSSGGVNRYLLVTTRVNEDQFPPPDLLSIPQSVEELKELLYPDIPAESTADQAAQTDAEPTDEPNEQPAVEPTEQPAGEPAKPEPAAPPAAAEAQPDTSAATTETTDAESPASEPEEPADDEILSEDSEGDGSDEAADDEAADDEAADVEDAAVEDEPTATAEQAEPATSEPAADASEQTGSSESADAGAESSPADLWTAMSDDEKQERLESEQEIITKENQRKVDERNDKMEAARKRVRELNARFADWYYVIPETTYQKLRIKRNELFEPQEPAAAATPGATDPSSGPSIEIPDLSVPGGPDQ